MSALGNALIKLSPDGKWRILGEDRIENIEWEIEPENKPTDEEIKEEVVKQEKLIQDTQYQRDRAPSYPEITEQLDLLYHDMTAGKGDKTGEWYKAVNKVKADNPKPE